MEVGHGKRGVVSNGVIIRGERFGNASTPAQRVAEVGVELLGEIVVAVVCFERFPVVVLGSKQEVVVGESWYSERVWGVEVRKGAFCVAEVVLNACGGH